MARTNTIGLLGYGRICRALAEYVEGDPAFDLEYVYVRSERDELPADLQVTDPNEPSNRLVDLEAHIERVAVDNGMSVYLPHAALLGIDGLVDARPELESVSIEATKAPSHLDFAYTDEWDESGVTERTAVYDGPVRGLCRTFPRNFNSNATVALAPLDRDETQSRVVADPDAESALHVISASGDGFDLEITRDSAIKGVTGDYTLTSIWGSIRRVLDIDGGLRFV